MKSKRIIIVCSLFLSIAFVAASCGGRSNQDPSYSQEESDYGVSRSSSMSRSTQDYNSDDRESSREVEKGGKLKICNTKWSFVDAVGNNFVLYINGMARDGKTAKMELEKNGKIVEYGTVKPKYRDILHDTGFIGYEFNGSGDATETKIFYNSSDFGCWIQFGIWDYEAGYLYKDKNAYDAEAPNMRLKIKKVR